LGEGN
jgi:hypothetical protein